MDRIIALTDANAFFASCLQAADPKLRGTPWWSPEIRRPGAA